MELDSPEMARKDDDFERDNNQTYLIRSSSVMNDPGVVGPIVWDLRRHKAIEGEFFNDVSALVLVSKWIVHIPTPKLCRIFLVILYLGVRSQNRISRFDP